MDSHLAAYLAGLIDGEGSLQIIRYRRPAPSAKGVGYRCNITVRMTDNAACLMLWHAIPGSHYYKIKAPQSGRRDNYAWGVYDRACGPVLDAIYPYLVVKREQAQLLQAYLLIVTRQRRTRAGNELRWSALDKLWDHLRMLHRHPQIVEPPVVLHGVHIRHGKPVETEQGGV